MERTHNLNSGRYWFELSHSWGLGEGSDTLLAAGKNWISQRSAFTGLVLPRNILNSRSRLGDISTTFYYVPYKDSSTQRGHLFKKL